MKYLKYFELASAYETYKNGSDYILPNISYIGESNEVKYGPNGQVKKTDVIIDGVHYTSQQ